MDEWTSNEDVEPEMAAMEQADIVWMEMEWDRMEREEMEAVKVQVPAEGRPSLPPGLIPPTRLQDDRTVR